MTNPNIDFNTIIYSELMKEIIKIRIDTVWKMFALIEDGYFPEPEEEGATGDFDNKGALFIPGGLLFEDADGNQLGKKDLMHRYYDNFSETVRYAMKHDNATVFYEDFAQIGITLPNEFLSKTAIKILNMRNVLVNKKKRKFDEYIPKVDTNIISRCYSPKFIAPPYGARMKISSALAVCRSEPYAYFLECINYYSLKGAAEERFWGAMNKSLDPILNDKNGVRIPSEIIICHTSRYTQDSLVGLTRILGLDRIGRSATFTIEILTPKLEKELDRYNSKISKRHIVAEYKNKKVVGVFRFYSTRGHINYKSKSKLRYLKLIDPVELAIDVDELKKDALNRYF